MESWPYMVMRKNDEWTATPNASCPSYGVLQKSYSVSKGEYTAEFYCLNVQFKQSMQ